MTIEGPTRHPALFAAACAAMLAGYNNLVSRLPGYPGLYLPLNLAATGLLLAAARGQGLSSADLGLGPGAVRRGVRTGAPAAALVAGGYLAALRTPARALLHDQRVQEVNGAQLVYQAGIRIPVGTVLWEELAFRGVLLAALRRVLPDRSAVAVDSLIFGVWHLRPTRDAISINRPNLRHGLKALLVAGGVASTAFGGALLCHLRMRSRSLLTPALLHLATNSLGVLASATAKRCAPVPGTAGCRRPDR